MGIRRMFFRHGNRGPTPPKSENAWRQPFIRALQNGREIQLPELGPRHFEFVLVHMDEAKPDEVVRITGGVLDTVFEHGAMVMHMISSLLLATFGVPPQKPAPPERRLALVETLLREYGSQIRIAHGQCCGLVGTIGSDRRHMYQAMIPEFSAKLRKLLDAEFGTAIEVS